MFRVVTKFGGKIVISTQLTRVPDKTGTYRDTRFSLRQIQCSSYNTHFIDLLHYYNMTHIGTLL